METQTVHCGVIMRDSYEVRWVEELQGDARKVIRHVEEYGFGKEKEACEKYEELVNSPNRYYNIKLLKVIAFRNINV